MKAAHIVLAVIVGAVVAAIAFSQPAEEERRAGSQLEDRLDALNDTLLLVSDTLDVAVTQQRANLLLKRVELAHFRMQPDHAKLSRLQNDRRSARESLEQMRLYRQQVLSEVDAANQAGDPGEVDTRRRLLRELDARIEENDEQVREAEDQIERVEFDMQARQQAIEELDGQLLDLLDQLDSR